MKRFILSLLFSVAILWAYGQNFAISQTMAPDLSGTQAEFGTSVCIYKDLIAVSSTHDNSDTGRIYIFLRKLKADNSDTTVLIQKIDNPKKEPLIEFGESMDMDQIHLVVGAPMDDTSGTNNVGSVFIFSYDGTTWQYDTTLLPSKIETANFGTSVLLYGNYLFVGAPAHNSLSTVGIGRVYIFYYDGTKWTQINYIDNPDTAEYAANFGTSLAYANNILAVGATGGTTGLGSPGKVHIFQNDGTFNFTLDTTLYDASESNSIKYGYSIALNDSLLLIGAPDYNSLLYTQSGKAYLYDNSSGSWSLVTTFESDAPSDDAQFGYSTLLLGDTLLITDILEGPTYHQYGHIFLYTLQAGSWQQLQKISAPSDENLARFGYSVDYYGHYLVTGAIYYDTEGRAFLLTRYPRIWYAKKYQDNVCPGSQTEFYVLSNNATAYQWQVSTDGGTTFTSIADNDTYSGTQSYKLYITVNNLSLQNNLYRCIVKNILDSVISDTCYFTNDYQAPNLTTKTTTVLLDSLGKGIILADSVVDTVYDNCSLADTTLNIDTVDCQNLGTLNITVTVTDSALNTTSQSINITVSDNIKPHFDFHNIYAYLDSSGTGYFTADQMIYHVWDNCSVADTTLSQNSVDCYSIDEPVDVIVTITDGSGNTYDQAVTVYGKDTIPPQGFVHDINVYLDSSGTANITANDVVDSVWDNCFDYYVSKVLTKDQFSCADLGAVQDTAKFYDYSSNYSFAVFKVTVIDTIKPQLVTVDTFNLYLDSAGYAHLNVSDIVDSAWDNCLLADTALNKTDFYCSDIGYQTVSALLLDKSGNSTTKSFIVNVLDTIPPTLLVKDTVINVTETFYVVDSTELDPIISDNCGVSASSNLVNSFNNSYTLAGDTLPLGQNYITWTLTDNSNNSVSKTSSVFVAQISTQVNNADSQVFVIYPNPTQAVITIKTLNTNLLPAKVKVVNSQGREVVNTLLMTSQKTINLSGLSSGVYFIKIVWSQGMLSYRMIKL